MYHTVKTVLLLDTLLTTHKLSEIKKRNFDFTTVKKSGKTSAVLKSPRITDNSKAAGTLYKISIRKKVMSDPFQLLLN